jgi:hypothetical protein
VGNQGAYLRESKVTELTPQTAPLQCMERVIKPIARLKYDQTTETSSAACERSRARSKRKQTKQENLSAKATQIAAAMVLCPHPRVLHRGTHQPRQEPKNWLLRFVLCSNTDPWAGADITRSCLCASRQRKIK